VHATAATALIITAIFYVVRLTIAFPFHGVPSFPL
jgi:hypothetical protein